MKIKVGGKEIGEDAHCFVIAEVGMNHNGDLEMAKAMIKAAAANGADCVKFQTFTAEKLVTKHAATFGAVKSHLPAKQQEMYKKYEFSRAQWKELVEYSKELDVLFFSSCWDEENVDMLDELGMAMFKVGSADITHIPLLKHIARKNKPVMIATGASTIDEMREAVNAIKEEGNNKIILLHCTLSYPTQLKDANIRCITTLIREFPDCIIGISDHTMDNITSIASTALGSKVTERHFTIDKRMPGVDHHLSMDPEDLKIMVQEIRKLEQTLGTADRSEIFGAETETRKMARRSVIAKIPLKKGVLITKEMLVIKRPGTGIAPKDVDKVVGKKPKKDIEDDEVLQWDMLE